MVPECENIIHPEAPTDICKNFRIIVAANLFYGYLLLYVTYLELYKTVNELKATSCFLSGNLIINGQILHNHYHGNMLSKGKIMVTDAGSETDVRYASDITRSVPVGGKFLPKIAHSQLIKNHYLLIIDATLLARKIFNCTTGS